MAYAMQQSTIQPTVDCYSHISCHFLSCSSPMVLSSLILPFSKFIDYLFEVTAFWSYHSLSTDPFVSGDLMFVPFVIMIPVVAVSTLLSRL
jgi:hypothetical protein